LNIPGDIAIVGFNNDAISKLVEPQLTTIDYPGEYMGEVAAQSLINLLKEKNATSKTNTIIIDSNLIIRQSSLRKG
jgi:LacI family transcriptional regulator